MIRWWYTVPRKGYVVLRFPTDNPGKLINDTVGVPRKGYVVLRFPTDNPGKLINDTVVVHCTT